MRREVTAMVTHDLKSPLQTVRSFLEMLALGRLGQLNEKGAKLVPKIEQQTTRMAGLDSKRAAAGTIARRSEHTRIHCRQLSELLKDSIGSVQILAEEKEITFELDLKEAPAWGEAKWIKQIFVNVLVNAINYSPDKSTVRATSQSLEKFSEVRISDNGPGLNEQEKIMIFERFNRLDRKGDQLAGSGLGLTICKELIALHEGYIKVESEPGLGSTFVLGFPKQRSS